MGYEAVIGIEIHCELKTKTKMFSGAPLGYGQKPNTAINEIDLSYPGTLPQLNKQAVNYGVRLCKALNCEIDDLIRFDRKNYFYSDLPKGYQITQQFFPLGQHGHFDVLVGETVKHIRINRIHMEEDTAKQFHEGDKTLIDFNRAGTPLLEIVTEADFRTGEEAAAYVDALRLLVVYLGISDGRMDEGSLRCDVNISLRPEGQEAFGTKVEIKNLNSTNNVQKSIEFESIRQAEILNSGQKVVTETRRFDEKTQETVAMRTKETAVDYRYFVEPNIVPVRIGQDILNQTLVELPMARIQRYQDQMGLSLYDANVLVKNPDLAAYFDVLAQKTDAYKLLVNWLTQDVLAVLDQKGERSFESWLNVDHFVDFIEAIQSGSINSKQAKQVFAKFVEGESPKDVIKKSGMVQISDEATITAWIEDVLTQSPQVIEDYKNGLDKSIKFVVGQVMKVSKGQANPRVTNELVVRVLDNK
ncbi:Asp-tRNA(Asn)/Glu-tRNA(Gln) amidotransferase subunit GatB [Erysipelothrix amsterdamensis]|uniref:Aspartyl/glutamyl-tRNA(Asn/Gln) amidotransferase subunit B n=1 Tax=Erysipelothrix amsterdamensis TaxID=2929157 RepID=A0AAU9VHU2_9FIRM|nr:Asp-tRNA(Asn)/Glu-tRNA(Gln) amidotransferase subunit GatB [Erysipelothrix sp. A18Y020d]CAH2761353.1 Asp-tRNA(Asn)/Glu-tRNA(Gln) amidotransferase subunit GatB [Erysipelothrix sp. A18Y020d]